MVNTVYLVVAHTEDDATAYPYSYPEAAENARDYLNEEYGEGTFKVVEKEINTGFTPSDEWHMDDLPQKSGTLQPTDSGVGHGPDDTMNLTFAGGTRARVKFYGSDEVNSQLISEIREAQRRWDERFNVETQRVSSVIDDSAKWAIEELPRPLNFLASALMEANEEVWLEDSRRARTHGADRVRTYGLTTNQYRWVLELAFILSQADYDLSEIDVEGGEFDHPATN